MKEIKPTNETGNNPETEQEKEVLPSFFQTLKTSASKPLPNREVLEYTIMHSAPVKTNTEGYRAMMKVDKRTAEDIKHRLPCITPSVQLKGNSKKLTDFQKETYWLMLDYDDVPPENIAALRQTARNIPFTMVFYITVSGKGFRILLRYMRPEGCNLTATELHQLAIQKAMKLYDNLLGISSDKQCQDMVRSCGLAYDPEAYFNWNAEILAITREEVEEFEKATKQQEEQNRKRQTEAEKPRKKSPRKQEDEAPPKTLTTEEILQYVDKLAERWEERFEEHHHNSYVVRYATFCLCFGAEKEEAVKHMADKFGGEYADTERVAREIYKHTERLGTWKIRKQGDDEQKRYTSMRALLGWLGARYEMHHNTLSNQYEVRAINTGEKLYLDWTEVDTRVSNSLFVKMELDNICTTQKKLDTVIRSNFSPEFNPMEEYLKSLPKWDRKTDYIAELAQRVTVMNTGGYRHTEEDFAYAFKKWLVNMVVCWVRPDVTNQSIMVFVGKGGIFKTTFFDHLLPPHLRKYFANDSTGDYKNKDFLQMCASKAIVCLDEFSCLRGKNLDSFKSNITKRNISMRIPYAEWDCILQNNAGFCATSNEIHIIDDDENRRFLIWRIEKIKSPIDFPFNYEGIYSQAVALAQEVIEKRRRGEPCDWVYWFTKEENEEIQRHNLYFRVNNYIAERINKFYRVPDADTPSEFCKFVTASDVMERICTNPAFRQSMSNKDISMFMEALGFKKIHRKTGNGWKVIEMRPDEIENNQKMDGSENIPPEDLPF
mgnify:FL=1